jgi:hypothetical protein
MSIPAYDRQFLLFGPRRDEVVDLAEIQRYGQDSFGNPDHVSIYGMRPAAWWALGVRLLGRTAVECTSDPLARTIAAAVAETWARRSPAGQVYVIDPFAGSANTLFWILRSLPGSAGLGLEVDPRIHSLTRQNLRRLGSPIEVLNADYQVGLRGLRLDPEAGVVAFIAPPWGHALSATDGLNLGLTAPPVSDIIDLLVRLFERNPLLFAVQVLETVEEQSLQDVQRLFDWSEVRIFDLAPTGGWRPGVVLGTKGWVP